MEGRSKSEALLFRVLFLKYYDSLEEAVCPLFLGSLIQLLRNSVFLFFFRTEFVRAISSASQHKPVSVASHPQIATKARNGSVL